MKVILSGGLGNQMFQYAFFFVLKDKRKKVILDGSLYGWKKMHNGCELEHVFGITDVFHNYSFLNVLKIRLLLKFRPKKFILLDDFTYNSSILNEVSVCYLSGYWQSEKYFSFCASEIRDIFRFKNISCTNLDIARQMKNCHSISLHIRRGDYVGDRLLGGIVNDSYYIRAIDFLARRFGNIERFIFFIFSDDKDYSVKLIKELNIFTVFVDHNTGENNYFDMYLMTQCKHNIISNSSFSWWGAWLNQNENKVVIAPKVWMNTDEKYYIDIVPDEWIKI